uniref:Kinectin n=1 Tax=Caenorhabditis tropicalis TaxID=1561998 RepID=A0A1I7TSN8_9PELO
MDNFTIWVDAPTEALIETPMEDESSCFLRDEILQTQQYVIEKLDEQKTNEQEKGDHEAKAAAKKIISFIAAEGKRTKDVNKQLVGLREACKTNELKLNSLKNDFPAPIAPSEDDYEKVLSDTKREILVLQESFAARESKIKKLLEMNPNGNGEEARKACKKLREMVLEAKQKHDQIKSFRQSVQELEEEYKQALTKQLQKAAQKVNEELVVQLTEECVSLRSQLIQLEATQSKHTDDVDQNEIATLNQNKKETEDAQKQIDTNQKEELENEKLIKKRKKEIIELLKQKITEAEKKMVTGTKQKKILELKNAISKETEFLEKAKKDLENANPNKRSISDLKKEVAALGTEIRDYEKKIREATKENDKLINEIQLLRSFTSDTTPPIADLNDTDEYIESEYSTQAVVPNPASEVTPVQRIISRDIITDAPLMTSTPLHKISKTEIKTRAAARRLEKTAAAKTAEIRKKRGGKK